MKQAITVFEQVSCLYFLILEERKDTYVVKFGMTDDLKRRLVEHLRVFGNVYIMLCRYIEKKDLYNAERELYEFFNENYIAVEEWPKNVSVVRREVFEIKKSDIKAIKKIYNNLGMKYSNGFQNINGNMNFQNISLKDEINDLQENEKIKHFYEMKIKELNLQKDFLKNDFEMKLQEKKNEQANMIIKLEKIEDNYKKIIENMKIKFDEKEDIYKRDIDDLYMKLEISELKLSIYLN